MLGCNLVLYLHKFLNTAYSQTSYQYHQSEPTKPLFTSSKLIHDSQIFLAFSISVIQLQLMAFTSNLYFRTFPKVFQPLLLFILYFIRLFHRAQKCILSYLGKLCIIFMHKSSRQGLFLDQKSCKSVKANKLQGLQKQRGT